MDIKQELKALNIHYTNQRADILNLFKKATQPLTVQQLYEALEDVDLSTIYRTLELFETKKIIVKTELKEPLSNIYEYKKDTHNHHLICMICKEIKLIEECPLSEYEKNIMEKTGYLVKDHELNLYGICPQCQLTNK